MARINPEDVKGKRIYRHKPWICGCDPNYAEGDPANANHREPRNEYCETVRGLLNGVCLYCNQEMTPQEEWDEVIKRGGYGSWQTNRPPKK